ncbi:GNAT family N-acetyltransferase [uncultured Enterovirga sp.]|uniref:GNAT family N-acetyltransferase n=1 Tax=uncultured Enterovirga sp. TaxID=2026352 RepID=UPI0035CA8F01
MTQAEPGRPEGECYGFQLLTPDHLPLIRRWLVEPHVSAWWTDPEEQYDLISGDLQDTRVEQWLLVLDGRPIGYAQVWKPEDWPGNPFSDQPAGTCGIDPFIGEPDHVGQGHGSSFLRLLADRLLQAGAPRVMIDPDPDNHRAVRAYARADFRSIELRHTEDGPALLMTRDTSDPR